VSDAPVLPPWAELLKQRYVSGASALFVLHGNVHDLVPYEGEWVPLRDFLSKMLSRTKETVVFYDVASGLSFADKKMEVPFRQSINSRRLLEGRAALPPALPRDAYRLFPFIETFLKDRNAHGGVVVEYAETVVPDGDVSFMGESDRAMRVTLQRWSHDPGVLATDNLIILVTENFADLDRDVRSAPRLSAIEIPMPDEAVRTEFLTGKLKSEGSVGMSAARIASGTAGLNCFQLEDLLREVRVDGGKLSAQRISELKRRAIESECFGLVEFLDSEHDFSVVGGMKQVKGALNRVVESIRKGHKDRVPMGILIVGPMGTGKSFMMEAFGNEVGMTALKLKNFRDKWVGSTEGNLEKILGIVKALGNVMVVIDEGDRSIGGDTGGGDGGVDSRVMARLKEFMSDTTHRGSILFVMMTNRPDKLDADMKRPGRFDLKLPFFPPQTEEERTAITKALFRKNKIKHRISDYSKLSETMTGMTGAEIEAILLQSINWAEDRGSDQVIDVDVQGALDDFIPSRDMAMLRYMELLAVFECSSRRLLPERYAKMNTEELNFELRAQQGRLLKP
jgi:AAA+ superfamily predicted ATPase